MGKISVVYEAIAECLCYVLNKYQARQPGYVYMPSHIHLLLALQGIHLGDFMRDFKKYTAQKSLKELARSDGGVWMPRYDRVGIRTLKVFETKLIYIHENPVRAGLVERVQDWKWSSARVYLENADSDIPVWTGWR